MAVWPHRDINRERAGMSASTKARIGQCRIWTGSPFSKKVNRHGREFRNPVYTQRRFTVQLPITK